MATSFDHWLTNGIIYLRSESKPHLYVVLYVGPNLICDIQFMQDVFYHTGDLQLQENEKQHKSG